MKYTNNYNLRKPEGNDKIDVDDFNYNIDAIDQLLKPSINDGKAPASNSEKLADTLSGMANRIKSITGNISWTDEPALNLKQVKEASNTLVTLLEDVKNHSNQLESPKYSNNITTKAATTKIDTDTRKQLKITGVKGRTVVNLLGNDGDCEDADRWKDYKTSHVLDSANKIFGDNSLKVILGSNEAGSAVSFGVNITANKWYCLSAYIKNGTASFGSISISGKYSSTESQRVTDTTKYNRVFFKYKATSDETIALNINANGQVNQFIYCDGYMLNEITEQEYNDANYQPPPYVNGEASIENSEFKCVGKNLIKNIKESIVLNNNAETDSLSTVNKWYYEFDNLTVSYDSKGNISICHKTSNIYSIVYLREIVPSTKVTLSFKSVSPNAKFGVNILDKDFKFITALGGYITDNPHVYEMPSNAKYLKLVLNSSDMNTATYEGIQLEYGDHATTYEEIYKETKAKIPYPLRSISGTVYDEVDKNGILNKHIEKVVLDGNLNYKGISTDVGFKGIIVSNFCNMYNAIPSGGDGKKVGEMIKYNNKIVEWGNVNIGNRFNFYLGDLYVGIPNTDSGWGENYTPTADEIRAYFLGWTMMTADGNGEYMYGYNGTGTKVWGKIWCGTGIKYKDGIAIANEGSPTLPTIMNDRGWTPYRLYYQLLTPQQIDLNLLNLVAEPNGSFVISSDYDIIPETSYQLCDNLKANVDDLMVQVAKDREYLNILYQNNVSKKNLNYPILLTKWEYYQNYNKLYYTKIGKVVYCRGYLTNKETIIIPSYLFIFAEGYRPRTLFSIGAIAIDNNFKTYNVLCDISPDGRFWVGYGIPTDLRFISFNFSFDVE